MKERIVAEAREFWQSEKDLLTLLPVLGIRGVIGSLRANTDAAPGEAVARLEKAEPNEVHFPIAA